MANSYLLETLRATTAIPGLQIATLIGSLSRSVALLTVDIGHEEARAGVRDLADPAYPVLARSLKGQERASWTVCQVADRRVEQSINCF